jgi:cell shape-determining protein MreC
VAAGGLVGTVRSAAAHIATVELLTDPNFRVGVSLQGGNTGSAAGTGRDRPMRIEVLSTKRPQPVEKVGAVISTSGLSNEKFPKAIPIGRVSKVVTAPGAIEPEIEVVPMVDPLQLSYLQVLLWLPQ